MDMGEKLTGCFAFAAVILVVIIVLVLAGGLIWSNIQDSAAQAAQARASEIRAQADLEYTRATVWEQRFMLWTSYLEHKSEDGQTLLVLVSAIAGALVARPVTFWLARITERQK